MAMRDFKNLCYRFGKEYKELLIAEREAGIDDSQEMTKEHQLRSDIHGQILVAINALKDGGKAKFDKVISSRISLIESWIAKVKKLKDAGQDNQARYIECDIPDEQWKLMCLLVCKRALDKPVRKQKLERWLGQTKLPDTFPKE
jgi:hypothetical protein